MLAKHRLKGHADTMKIIFVGMPYSMTIEGRFNVFQVNVTQDLQ